MIPSLLAVASAALAGMTLAHPYLPPLPAPRRDAARLNGGRTLGDIIDEGKVRRRAGGDVRRMRAHLKRRARREWNLSLVECGGLQAVARG